MSKGNCDTVNASASFEEDIPMIKKVLLAVAMVTLATPVFADAGVRLGTLTCRLTGIDNMIVYTDEKFACSFQHTDGSVESYIGEIKKVGIDLSVKKNYTLVWLVLAATAESHKPGGMAGTYVGASADAAVGAGGGAQYLIGGFNKSISLQPYSVAGETGTGVSVGIESFELK